MRDQGLGLLATLLEKVLQENQRQISKVGILDMPPSAWLEYAEDAFEAFRSVMQAHIEEGIAPPILVFDSSITAIAILMKIAEMCLKLDIEGRVKGTNIVKDQSVRKSERAVV